MPFYMIQYLLSLVIIGLFMFGPLSHSNLLSNTALLSGPFLSYESWITPISNLFEFGTEGSNILFDWILTNPAVLTPTNIIMVVLIFYYWQRVNLFKVYIEDKKKVSLVVQSYFDLGSGIHAQ